MRKILFTLTMIFCLLSITPILAAQNELYAFDTYPYMDNWGETEFGSWLDIPISDLESMSTKTLLRSYLSNVDVLDWMYYGHVEDLEWIATELVPEYPLLKELFSRDDLTETLFFLYEDSYIYDSEEWKEMLSSPVDTKEGWENRVKLWEQGTLEELMLLDQFANGNYTENELATALQLLIEKNAQKRIAPNFYKGQSHFVWSYYAQKTKKLPDPLEYIASEYLYENTLPEDLDPVYLKQVDAYTPMGEKVTAFVRLDEMSQDEKEKLNLKFPNFEKLGEPTYRYNGFSYAFYSQDTAENRYWIDDISPYIEGSNPSYYKVNNVAKQDGDIVVLNAKDGKWLAAGVIKMNPPGSFHTWNILCKMGYGGAYNLTENAFKGAYRNTYSMSYYRKVENNGYWEQEWPYSDPIIYDDEILGPGILKVGTSSQPAYIYTDRAEPVPLATINSSSTIDLIKLLLQTNKNYPEELFQERTMDMVFNENFSPQAGQPGNRLLAIQEYNNNILYELLRRSDLTEALFEAYKSEQINPCWINRDRARKLNEAIASVTGMSYDELKTLDLSDNGYFVFPNGITGEDFDITLDITRHGYLEHLMILDQIKNGLYTEEEKVKLTKIFNNKNAIHRVDFELFGESAERGVYPAGGYYNTWECILHDATTEDEQGNGYRTVKTFLGEPHPEGSWTIAQELIPNYEGGDQLVLDERFHPTKYLNPDITNLERTVLDRTLGYRYTIYTPLGQAFSAYYDCRPQEAIEENYDISDEKYQEIWNNLLKYEKLKNIKILGAPTWRYNCHSYAWWYRNTENPYCFDSFDAYTKFGCMKQISFKDAEESDIAVYLAFDLSTWSYQVVHSAVIKEKGYTQWDTVVQSKWGEGFLLEHNLKTRRYLQWGTGRIEFYHCNAPIASEPLNPAT